MADSMAGHFQIARLEAATDLLPQGEITEVPEDDYIPLDIAGAGHTAGEGSMAASFNVDEGIKAPIRGLPRPETIPKLLEDGYTFLYDRVADTIGWILRGSGSGSVISSGRVHDFVELPDDQVIVVLDFYIMEEFVMWDWFRNFFCFLRRNGYEFISLSDTHGWVYKHDCIVVKIADEGTWIKAEKGGESSPWQDDGGIKLVTVRSFSHPKDWKDRGDIDSGRYSVRFAAVIKLGRCKEKFTVKQLKQLLSPSWGLDYSIFSSNCWQYAFSGAYNVLIWILENSEDEECRMKLGRNRRSLSWWSAPCRRISLAWRNPSAREWRNHSDISTKIGRHLGRVARGGRHSFSSASSCTLNPKTRGLASSK